MSNQPTLTMAHFGICVKDMEKSLRFYTQALGCKLDYSIDDFGSPFDKLTDLPGLKARASFLNHGGFRVELLEYDTPEPFGDKQPRPMNQLGISHMVLTVDDLDVVVERIVALGGAVLSHTRVDSPVGPFIYCTDPDGVRLELWQKTE